MNKSEKKRMLKELKEKKSAEFDVIELYPKIENVLADTSLKCYFHPLLTYRHTINGKDYKIHLLGTDGLYCEESFLNSERNFFGFDYNDGKYKFLGNIECFIGYEKIPMVYDFLIRDFQENKDGYLSGKVSTEKYLKGIENELKKLANFENFDAITYYAEAIYSYEFTKYNYEKTGEHVHISAITDNFVKDKNNFLLDKNDALSVLDEFFINLQWNLENDYGISKDMFCCATDRFRFMSIVGDGMVFALLDKSVEKIYILEYSS